MSQFVTYQYSSLSDDTFDDENRDTGDGNEPTRIRLMTIQPGAFSDDIVVNLDAVRLDPVKPPQYDALSYVWGVSENPETIYVGGEKKYTLKIGNNLAEALRHLRYPIEPRTIWIDAVCINQNDIPERGIQVANMGNIYRLAARIIAWLGAEEDGSDQILELLDTLGSKLEIDPMTRALKPSATGEKEAYLADRSHRLHFDTRELLGLRNIFQRPWFDRLWIRQEIYLGHASALVQVGFKTVSWKNFSLAALRILRNEMENEGTPVREQLAKRLVWLQELFYHDIITLESIRRTCGRCQCFDPRDRVYAVMNMVPEHQKRLIGIPDYSLPATEVWKRAVLSYIEYHKTVGPECLTLLILDECVGQEPFDRPTWMPNWEVEDLEDSTRTFTFLAMAGMLMTPKVEYVDPNILRVLGVRVQTVDTIVPVPSRKELISSVKKFMHGTPLDKPYLSGGTFMDACVYTFLGGQVQETTSPPRDDKPTELEIRQSIQEAISASNEDFENPDLPNVGLSKFRGVASDCLVGRSLIKTKDGYIGVAPKRVKAGDQVVVFAGGHSPVILRPSTKDSSQYHLMGTCFLQGFMWLEAFLGPLPAGHRYVVRQEPGENYVTYKVFNSKTGEYREEDPRVAAWPIAAEYLKACEADDFYTIDVDSEVNKCMGINVEYFPIV